MSIIFGSDQEAKYQKGCRPKFWGPPTKNRLNFSYYQGKPVPEIL